MNNQQTYALREFDEAYLKSMQHQLIKMTGVLSSICIKDRPPIKSRHHNEFVNISAYKNIRVNALLNNICCNETCSSFVHEEAKKLLFLEKIFNSQNLSLSRYGGDITILQKYNSICDAFVQDNPNYNFEANRLYELDAIEKHEHIEEINKLADELKQLAFTQQFDLKYNEQRTKTMEAQKKFEQNPAHPLIRSRRTYKGTFDNYVQSNSKFPVFIQIKQILNFNKTFPYVIKYDTILELKELENKYIMYQKSVDYFEKLKTTYNPTYGMKDPEKFTWAKRIVDKVNSEFSIIRGLDYGKSCPTWDVDKTLLDNLQIIANSNDVCMGFDIICEAKSLLVEYGQLISVLNREKYNQHYSRQ